MKTDEACTSAINIILEEYKNVIKENIELKEKYSFDIINYTEKYANDDEKFKLKYIKYIALRNASRQGHLDVIKYLIEYHNINVHINDEEALINASEYGHLDIVQYLVEICNADIHIKGNYALNIAAAKGHLDIVMYLQRI